MSQRFAVTQNRYVTVELSSNEHAAWIRESSWGQGDRRSHGGTYLSGMLFYSFGCVTLHHCISLLIKRTYQIKIWFPSLVIHTVHFSCDEMLWQCFPLLLFLAYKTLTVVLLIVYYSNYTHCIAHLYAHKKFIPQKCGEIFTKVANRWINLRRVIEALASCCNRSAHSNSTTNILRTDHHTLSRIRIIST